MNKTNHNLRATSISRMYEASVPEKIIMERSGHLSKVRCYERTSAEQVKSLCNILSPKPENAEGNSESGVKKESGTKILTTDDTSDKENTGKPSDFPELLNFHQVGGVKKKVILKF